MRLVTVFRPRWANMLDDRHPRIRYRQPSPHPHGSWYTRSSTVMGVDSSIFCVGLHWTGQICSRGIDCHDTRRHQANSQGDTLVTCHRQHPHGCQHRDCYVSGLCYYLLQDRLFERCRLIITRSDGFNALPSQSCGT